MSLLKMTFPFLGFLEQCLIFKKKNEKKTAKVLKNFRSQTLFKWHKQNKKFKKKTKPRHGRIIRTSTACNSKINRMLGMFTERNSKKKFCSMHNTFDTIQAYSLYCLGKNDICYVIWWIWPQWSNIVRLGKKIKST